MFWISHKNESHRNLATCQSIENHVRITNRIYCVRPYFPITAAYSYKDGLPSEAFIFQICKWIHGDSDNSENVCFRLSDDFVIDQKQPERTWPSVKWEYGIEIFTGFDSGSGWAYTDKSLISSRNRNHKILYRMDQITENTNINVHSSNLQARLVKGL